MLLIKKCLNHTELNLAFSAIRLTNVFFSFFNFQFTVIALVQPVEARYLTISYHGKEFCFNSGTSYSSWKELQPKEIFLEGKKGEKQWTDENASWTDLIRKKYLLLTRVWGPYRTLQTQFFPLRFMAQAWSAWAINREEKARIRNLQYEPRRPG